MEYVSIIFLFSTIVIISNIIGNLAIKIFNLSNQIPIELLGFLIWLSLLFIASQFINLENISSFKLFLIFLIITILLIIAGVKYFRFNYTLKEIFIVFIYSITLIYLSSRYTLGEQLGDSSLIFTLVTKNIDSSLLNNFDFGTGYVYTSVFVDTGKDALTFFHFNSFILHFFNKVLNFFSINYIPSYLLNMWTNNLLFYFFTSSLIISIKRLLRMEFWSSLLILLFSGLFIGTYYYNLTLPHLGVTFLGLGISMSLILVWQYLVTKEKKYIFILTLVLFSMNSMASTGMLVSAYLAFGLISILILKKDDKALLYGALLLIPISVYAVKVDELINIPYFVNLLIITILLLFIFNFNVTIRNLIYEYFIFILAFIFIMIIIVSIKIIPDYFIQILHFSDIKENFDRVRDYFSYTTTYQLLINIFHYVLLINLLINKKTREFGLILLIILLFFINPLSYPLLYKYTEWLYHRSYFTLFNITSISFGIFATINNLEGLKLILKKAIKIILTIAIIFFTFTNITTYENIIYIPGEDFSPLYKMNRQQIDILLKLYYEVQANNKENTRVISQIYGTLMIVPDVYHYMFTVSDRRNWDPNQKLIFPELYKLMYTPVFPGDDGPRYDMDYSRLCYVLGQEVEKVDYLLLDNTLTTFDSVTGNWVPMHWFARACSEKIYENERYTLYKYWGLGNQ